jgi:polyferredoxin
MSNGYIKNARVVISLAFFLSISLIFLDIKDIVPTSVIGSITYLQFLPSLTRFVTTLSLTAFGFVIVLLLTGLFGRIYCSTICPLGVLQDIFSFFAKKLRKRKKYKYAKAKNKLRYSILAGASILFLIGGIFFIYILDPFSIFGRLMTHVVLPVYTGLNNLIAKILEANELYILYPRGVETAGLSVIVLSFGMFLLIAWLSFRHGRIYCNTLCPVGTFLGILAKFSICKIEISRDACTNCGECSIVCKARCIDIKRKAVDFSRCVGCFNCIQVCPERGIHYRPLAAKKKSIGKTDQNRRRTVITAIFAALAARSGLGKRVFGANIPEQSKPTEVPEDKHYPVCPPGSVGIDHFVTACTACQLCVSACPTDVLQPSILVYGVLGFMQPVMNYSIDFCNYECTRCIEVCPSGAILPLFVEEKKLTQIGKVHFIKENCIVYTDNTACGSCSEHCPTQAVHMVPYKKGITIPEINESVCIGCGACEYACPTRPFRAIYVDGNKVHAPAEPPLIKKAKGTFTEEFPF